MSHSLPSIFLVRHGETAWTISRQHTGTTDLPLTEKGQRDAVKLGHYIPKREYKAVLTSPLQRARKTCELAGYAPSAKVDPDLVEWNYGLFEGKTTAEITKERPGWQLFTDGAPGGESVAEIGARADRVISRLRQVDGDALVFSSAHFIRVLAVRWLGLDVSFGRYFVLGTATLSVLGYEHDKDEPVIKLWNDERPGM